MLRNWLSPAPAAGGGIAFEDLPSAAPSIPYGDKSTQLGPENQVFGYASICTVFMHLFLSFDCRARALPSGSFHMAGTVGLYYTQRREGCGSQPRLGTALLRRRGLGARAKLVVLSLAAITLRITATCAHKGARRGGARIGTHPRLRSAMMRAAVAERPKTRASRLRD